VNWHKQLEESLDDIEEHLTGEIDLRHLGRLTHCSAYHYQRIFSFVVGTSLSTYVRRRKMTMAAADLQKGAKVIDVALKYGYGTPNSFANAFKRVHGIAPSKAAMAGSILKSYPRLRLQISVTGESEMEYRIEDKPAFRVVGVGHELSRNIEESFDEIPNLWQRIASGGTLDKLFGLANQEPMGLMGLTVGLDADSYAEFEDAATSDSGAVCCSDQCFDSINTAIMSQQGARTAGENPVQNGSQSSSQNNPQGDSSSNNLGEGLGNYVWCNPHYYIAVASDMDVPAGFTEYTVPSLTWAIFEGSGEISETSNAVRDLGKRILVEWLPSSGYKLANGPDIELFTSPDPANAQFEMWIPVAKG
jgi:AraC family transcriptional regulator